MILINYTIIGIKYQLWYKINFDPAKMAECNTFSQIQELIKRYPELNMFYEKHIKIKEFQFGTAIAKNKSDRAALKILKAAVYLRANEVSAYGIQIKNINFRGRFNVR